MNLKTFLPVMIKLGLAAIAWGLVIPAEISLQNNVQPSCWLTQAYALSLSSNIDGQILLASLGDSDTQSKSFQYSNFQKDQVVRVLDANTLKLKKNGIVTLAGVRMPSPTSSSFQFPECLSVNPSYKLRQLVPANSNVRVKFASSTSTGKSAQAIVLVGEEDPIMINQELVRFGFGRVQKIASSDLNKYLDMDLLQELQSKAKESGLGIFKRCDGVESGGVPGFEAQFEPLELTVETQYGDDGGKLVLRPKEESAPTPVNPGDRKGCSDFSTFEDALRWYETYFPFYGDVAKLDRDGDGIPCPGLPHTKIPEKYRMKIPDSVKQQ